MHFSHRDSLPNISNQILILTRSLKSPADTMASCSSARLARLRALMSAPQELRAYIIPTGDAHQSEYISDHDSRRAFLTGFTGSAGTAIVTPDEALLWTDGRYYLQAKEQLDSNWVLMKESLSTTLTREKWLVKHLPPHSTVGANPLLLANSQWEPLQTALRKAGHNLVPVANDLVDKVWDEIDGDKRPAQPANDIFPLALNYTGKTVEDKLKDIEEQMKEKNATMLVITALDEVAYFLNLRGGDIPFNPVFYAYVVIATGCQSPTRVTLFSRPLPPATLQQLKQEGMGNIVLRPYEEALQYVTETVTEEVAASGHCVAWVAQGSSYAMHLAAKPYDDDKITTVTDISPIAVMKAIKNEVETQGLINCHIRDGVALARYFSWLEEELTVKNNTTISEISGADVLEKMRSELSDYMGLSFSTISSSGSNGAIIHYHPEPETNRLLSTSEVYLCDSGAQFRDGTTDVTRTMHFGTPTAAQVEAFTLVLKGQMALGTAVFPNKIKGNVLDTLARRPLWQTGRDYGHGTGHGIGAFLNVHEGPMGISWREMPNDPGLVENMFLSNEPGYYENGEYGIRIEDIVRIVTLIPPGELTNTTKLPRGLKGNFDGRGALGFETITMCPIQKKMIDLSLLTKEEIQYLDDYHSTVWKLVSPLLELPAMEKAYNWLRNNTRPLVA